ncbi:MAG: hypothetical protein ACP5MU_00685 [Thermoplasmata archaeon]
MTVKEKVGRRRYVSIEPLNENAIYLIVRNIKNSSLIKYKGIRVIRIKHYQLDDVRKIAEKYNIKITRVSGTLKSLWSKSQR